MAKTTLYIRLHIYFVSTRLGFNLGRQVRVNRVVASALTSVELVNVRANAAAEKPIDLSYSAGAKNKLNDVPSEFKYPSEVNSG